MTNNPDGKRDFFISFNKADRAWATWVAWVLEDAGHSVLFQDWDFKGNFVLEMDRAHKETRRTIAILSPDYVNSRFTAPEWAARFAQDATSEHDLLIPVRVRDFDPKGLLAQIIYIDLVDATQEQARERLVNRVAGIRLKPKEEPFFPGGPLPAAQRSIPSEPAFPATLDGPASTQHVVQSHAKPPVAGKRKWFDLQTARGWIEALGVFVTVVGSAVGVYLQLFPNKEPDKKPEAAGITISGTCTARGFLDKILLCGRPDWGECGEPFAPGLRRAAVGILLQQPVLVIARDEGPDRGANLLGIAEDPAQHDLLLEGADEALRHTIGLGLADEGKARRHAEEGDLVLEVVGHKGAAVVVAQQKAAGGVGPHRPAGVVDGEIESLGGSEAVGLFGDVPAERLGVPVLDDHEEGDVAVLDGRDHGRVRAPHHAGRVSGDASVMVVDRPLRAAVRREQSILAHETEHPVSADAKAIEGAQAGPDLAGPLAGEGRAIEVAADRLEQPRIVDHRPRPPAPPRGRHLADLPG